MSVRRGAAVPWLAVMLAACARDPLDDPEYAAACHGPPVRGVEERQAAAEQGYAINQRYDCIDRKSWEEVERANALVAGMVAEAERQVREQAAAPQTPASLAAARAGFTTRLVAAPSEALPFPHPPAKLFVRSDYRAAAGTLAAWVTPDPGDGEKHPAIVWLTGGDSNSLDDFWTEGAADNDQTASAFRKAGVIMMFPTLRGGNVNPGTREYFFGEIDDVIAAGEHLASLPYVGSVYLGGHSTGGTLALLVAEASDRFEGVFAFGPVSEVGRYPPALVRANLADLPAIESKLRSPVHWLDGIGSYTYLIEGGEAPGNAGELETLCARTRNPFVRCVPVPGKNHFSVLDAAGKKIAARLAVGLGEDDEALLTAREFAR